MYPQRPSDALKLLEDLGLLSGQIVVHTQLAGRKRISSPAVTIDGKDGLRDLLSIGANDRSSIFLVNLATKLEKVQVGNVLWLLEMALVSADIVGEAQGCNGEFAVGPRNSVAITPRVKEMSPGGLRESEGQGAKDLLGNSDRPRRAGLDTAPESRLHPKPEPHPVPFHVTDFHQVEQSVVEHLLVQELVWAPRRVDVGDTRDNEEAVMLENKKILWCDAQSRELCQLVLET